MSIEETKAKIAVMQAAVDGKDIEYRVGCDDEWNSLGKDSYLWNWAKCEYRVAPPKPREVWIFQHENDGLCLDAVYKYLPPPAPGYKAIRFVEVL